MKRIIASGAASLAIVLTPAVAFAHVAVKPSEVGTAQFQTFTTSVPDEKDIAVTGVRITIPAGLSEVSPTVKPGWTIDTKKSGDIVTEISWSGGTIPAGQRDDFTFSGQAPAKTTTLNWKAYQTYEDGTVVAWDQKPDGKDSENSTPYSETKVVDDLAADTATNKPVSNDDSKSTATAGVALGTLGVLLGGAALLGSKRK